MIFFQLMLMIWCGVIQWVGVDMVIASSRSESRNHLRSSDHLRNHPTIWPFSSTINDCQQSNIFSWGVMGKFLGRCCSSWKVMRYSMENVRPSASMRLRGIWFDYTNISPPCPSNSDLHLHKFFYIVKKVWMLFQSGSLFFLYWTSIYLWNIIFYVISFSLIKQPNPLLETPAHLKSIFTTRELSTAAPTVYPSLHSAAAWKTFVFYFTWEFSSQK